MVMQRASIVGRCNIANHKDILNRHQVPECEKEYRKHFEIKETPKRGISVTYRQGNINQAHERCEPSLFSVLFSVMRSIIRSPKSSDTG